MTIAEIERGLGETGFTEQFLSGLLGRAVRLPHPPKLAPLDQSIYLYPDAEAAAEDGSAYQIYIGRSRGGSLVKELQTYGIQYDGSSDEVHVILICKGSEPPKHWRLEPAIVNTPDGHPVVLDGSRIIYHVLFLEPGEGHNLRYRRKRASFAAFSEAKEAGASDHDALLHAADADSDFLAAFNCQGGQGPPV